MTRISDFDRADAELIASLPYKVGIFVSHSDDQDGEADDEREQKALASCLRQFVKLAENKPLLASIMAEALKREDKWEQWTDESFGVLQDIKKAVPILRSKASSEEIKEVKRALMEVGTAVAQAFGEFGVFDDDESEGFFGRIIGKLSGLGEGDAGHPMNVSASEDSALEKLRATLQGKA